MAWVARTVFHPACLSGWSARHPQRMGMFQRGVGPPFQVAAVIPALNASSHPKAFPVECPRRARTAKQLAYVYARDSKADAAIGNVLTMDEARRIASNIAKLPMLLKAKALSYNTPRNPKATPTTTLRIGVARFHRLALAAHRLVQVAGPIGSPKTSVIPRTM